MKQPIVEMICFTSMLLCILGAAVIIIRWLYPAISIYASGWDILGIGAVVFCLSLIAQIKPKRF
jgi:hypothetical protein